MCAVRDPVFFDDLGLNKGSGVADYAATCSRRRLGLGLIGIKRSVLASFGAVTGEADHVVRYQRHRDEIADPAGAQ